MPVTSHAATGPLEQVWALGSFVNRLLSRTPGTLALVGVWLLALPSVLVLGGGAGAVLVQASGTDPLWMTLLFAAPAVIVAVAYVLLAVRVTWAYVAGR